VLLIKQKHKTLGITSLINEKWRCNYRHFSLEYVHYFFIVSTMSHHYQDLINLFEKTFFEQYNTRLVKGEDEPIYLPLSKEYPYHRIVFAHGYFASALHELAHWFVAGKERRTLEDYGYWYQPDGRDEAQQKIFEGVEIKPQAIEWALSVASNKSFNVSADNLNGAEADTVNFKIMFISKCGNI